MCTQIVTIAGPLAYSVVQCSLTINAGYLNGYHIANKRTEVTKYPMFLIINYKTYKTWHELQLSFSHPLEIGKDWLHNRL